MAHVGKYYPKHFRRDLAMTTLNGWVAPRKMFYKCTSFGTEGTLAAPWQGLEILSEEPDNTTNPDEIVYSFPHPTVPDNDIKCVWTIRNRVHPTPSQRRAYCSITFEFWYQGTKYGDFEFQKNTEVFSGVLRLGGQWDLWTHLLDVAEFRSITESFFYAATWAQQPEYHPYRYEP